MEPLLEVPFLGYLLKGNTLRLPMKAVQKMTEHWGRFLAEQSYT